MRNCPPTPACPPERRWAAEAPAEGRPQLGGRHRGGLPRRRPLRPERERVQGWSFASQQEPPSRGDAARVGGNTPGSSMKAPVKDV